MGEMKELEVKAWLNRAFYADKKVKALEMLVEKRREQATSVLVCYECNVIRARVTAQKTAQRKLL